jgi:hypothetical protein
MTYSFLRRWDFVATEQAVQKTDRHPCSIKGGGSAFLISSTPYAGALVVDPIRHT